MTVTELIDTLDYRLAPDDDHVWEEYGFPYDSSASGHVEFIRDENDIVNAVLQSLKKKGELEELYERISSSPELSRSITDDSVKKMRRILHPEPKPEKPRNLSIGRLLALYENKKSKQVRFAREDLMTRYEFQSFTDQRRILKAFLTTGSSSDRVWAAKKLYDCWDKALAEPLKGAWEQHHEQSVGITVLKWLPADYCLSQIKAFEDAEIDDSRIYSRLGNEPGFPYEINHHTLRWPDYYYVMAKLGRTVDEEEAREIMKSKLELYARLVLGSSTPDIFWNAYWTEKGCLTSDSDFGILVWSFGKLSLTDTLLELLGIVRKLNDMDSDNKYERAEMLYRLVTGKDGWITAEGQSDEMKEIETEEVNIDDTDIPENVREFLKEFV